METDTRLGTFEDVIAGCGAEIEQIARRIRAMIESVHPEAIEVPRPGERTAGYGVGPKKMSETYAYIAPYRDYVNLGFYQGAAVPDPDEMLEGAGKMLRHVKVRSLEDAGQPSLRRLVEAALLERRTALGRGDAFLTSAGFARPQEVRNVLLPGEAGNDPWAQTTFKPVGPTSVGRE